MKCRNCGAVVNRKTMVCEYCGSHVEPKKAKKANSKIGSTLAIAITIILVAAVVFVIVPVAMAFWFYDNHRDEYSAQQEERLVDKLPQEATDLVGEMGDCTIKGVAEIYYNDVYYDDVKILDSKFIDWMSKEGIGSNGKQIMFSTDADGNIDQIGIRQSDFVVMYQEGDTYVAFRADDGKIIAIETDIKLNVDQWYQGYYQYSDNRLRGVVATTCHEAYAKLSYKCKEKVVQTERTANSDKEVTVYKLGVGNDWYYCSKYTYDTVSVGDVLKDDYTFVLAEPYVYKEK